MVDTKRAYLALDKFASANTNLVEALRAAGITTLETARPVVIEWAAARTGCALIKSEHHLAKTPMVLDRQHAAFAAAQKAVQRVMSVLTAAAEGEDAVSHRAAPKDTVRVPKEIAALAAQLVAMCNEYESAKRLASQAVAEAFARVK